MDTEKNPLVEAFAYIIIGSALIGLVWALCPVPMLELFDIALFVLLPVFVLLGATGLMSMGTIKLIWSMGFMEALSEAVKEKRQARGYTAGQR